MSSWFDRFNKVWASKGLHDDPTDAQAEAGWAYIGQAPPTVEQFNATHSWWDNKDNWLYNQIAQVIIAGGMTPLETDITQLLKAIRSQQRVRLTASLTLYIDSVNGNDNNTGAAGSPFKTIGRGIYYIRYQVDQGGQQVTLQLSPGTYDPVGVNAPNNGLIVINGDRLAPRNYLIKNTNGVAVAMYAGSQIWLQGVSIEAAGATSGDYIGTGTGLIAASGSIIWIMDVAFGACTHFHMWAAQAGVIGMPSGGLSYTIYAGGLGHMMASAGGITSNVGANVTLQNNPAWSIAGVYCVASGTNQIYNSVYTGTATGKRYQASSVSAILSNNAGINFFPGNVAGTIDNNGVYT